MRARKKTRKDQHAGYKHHELHKPNPWKHNLQSDQHLCYCDYRHHCTVACIADSYHKINEGYVGIYFKHGALQDRVTDPGVHFMMPFIEDYKEVKIRPETFAMDSVLAITKDGIENTFREINTITTVRKDKLVMMAKKFGMDFKKTLVFDRIKEDLR